MLTILVQLDYFSRGNFSLLFFAVFSPSLVMLLAFFRCENLATFLAGLLLRVTLLSTQAIARLEVTR